jgi:L-iditol 2-dehydrogenase
MVRRMNETYPRAIDLAVRGAVSLEPLISRRADLADAAGAFSAAQRRSGLKVVLTP